MRDIAMAVVILGILGMAVYFVMNNHPWWAGLFVMLAVSVRAKE